MVEVVRYIYHKEIAHDYGIKDLIEDAVARSRSAPHRTEFSFVADSAGPSEVVITLRANGTVEIELERSRHIAEPMATRDTKGGDIT